MNLAFQTILDQVLNNGSQIYWSTLLVVPTHYLSIEIVLNIAENGHVPDLEICK